MPQLFIRLCVTLICTVLLFGCATKQRKVIEKPVAPDPKLMQPVLTPEHQTQYDLALSLMAKKQFAKASASFESLISIYPTLSGAHVNMGIMSRAEGQKESAIKHFHDALAINPANVDALSQLGVMDMKAGNFANAEELLLKAEAVNSENAQVHYNLGVLYELYLQDYDLAKEHYSKYVALGDSEDVKTVERWIKLLERK